jgi:hypothetical protein
MKKSKETEIYVYFHVGRGGRFYNAGHMEYRGEYDFQELLSDALNNCCVYIRNTDDNEQPLDDEAWTLETETGRVLLQGRDKIEARTGILDFDGEYHTDYVTTADELTDAELETLWDAYLREEYMSDPLKDALCTLKGKHRVASQRELRQRDGELEAMTQDGAISVVKDLSAAMGKYTREEWESNLLDLDFDELSVEVILDYMDGIGNDEDETDFFKED